jgi:Ca2+-transporting ATPase
MVIYFPWLQDVFQTEALGFWDLFVLVGLASSVFWADECRKWWRSKEKRRLGGGYSQVV